VRAPAATSASSSAASSPSPSPSPSAASASASASASAASSSASAAAASASAASASASASGASHVDRVGCRERLGDGERDRNLLSWHVFAQLHVRLDGDLDGVGGVWVELRWLVGRRLQRHR
jgi:hypothetical protein